VKKAWAIDWLFGRLPLLALGAYGAAFLLLAYLLPAWRNPARVHRLALHGRSVAVRLSKRPGQGHVHSLYMRVEGRGLGRVVVRQASGPAGPALRVDTVGSDFRLEYDGDWYQPDCYLRFEPLTAGTGPVRISYRFRDL
jgi:uncharacterized protein (DUF58 family)